jgi:hypothetical protein
VGTQNRIAFAPPLGIAARSNGTADCTVNPAIDKSNADFRFLPTRCSGSVHSGACRRAVVQQSHAHSGRRNALHLPRPGRCGRGTGNVYLQNSEQRGSTPDAVDLPALGRDGVVTVDEDETPVAVEVGTVRTIAGTRATVEVRFDALQPDAPPVAGTENGSSSSPRHRSPPAPTATQTVESNRASTRMTRISSSCRQDACPR